MLQIITGDCLQVLPTLPAASVQCCVTSPPYWGLRDYGVDGQLGLEEMPEAYVANMIAVFREVRRVLRDDGTLWLNLGDSYAVGKIGRDDNNPEDLARRASTYGTGTGNGCGPKSGKGRSAPVGLKPKDLVGIPWRVAFALQADGWYLRSDIIWYKPNPMPESVTDRPTKAHEYIFLLTKRERYFYDADAIKEPLSYNTIKDRMRRKNGTIKGRKPGLFNINRNDGGRPCGENSEFRNRRTVWTISTQPYAEAHFATFPEELPKLCILAGSKPGETVLDPFAGSGTTGKVALELGRKAILIELNPAYVALAKQRTNTTIGFF